MADNNDNNNNNVNKSNRPLNGLLGGVESRRKEQLGAPSADMISALDRLEQIESQQADVIAARKAATDAKERAELKKLETALMEKKSFAEERLIESDIKHAGNVNARIASEIGTLSRPQNIQSRTTTMAGTAGIYSSIQQKMRQDSSLIYTDTDFLEQQIAAKTQRAHELGQTVAGRVRGLGEEDWSEDMVEKAQEAQRLEREIAEAKKIKKMQVRAGTSSEKINNRADAAIEKYGLEEAERKIRKGVQAGEYTLEEELARKKGLVSTIESQQAKQDELKERQAALTSARASEDPSGQKYKDLTNELDNLGKDITELKKSLLDNTKELEHSNKVTDELARSGGGGRMGAMAAKAQFAAGMFGVVARTASTIGLDYELEQTNQRTAFANMVNRQYFNVDKAITGDMSAFVELTKGDAFAKAYADKMGGRAALLKGVEAGAATGDAFASLVTTKADFLKNTITGDQQQNLKNITETVQKGANATLQWVRQGMGLDRGAYSIKGYQSGKALFQAMSAIGTDALQTYYDVNMSAYQGGMGLGEGRGAFMDAMTDVGNMRNFAQAGMTGQQASQLFGQFAGRIGTTENAAQLVTRAGMAQMRGVMGRENYMELTGMLKDVGGGSQDLEDIMAKAVTAGMENAKNLNQMVQATAALASTSAATGFSTAGTAQEMIAASVQSMRGIGANKDLATAVSLNAMKSLERGAAEKGTLADYMFRAEAQNIFGDIDVYESGILANLTPDQAEQIARDPTKALPFLKSIRMDKRFGINEKGFTDDNAKERAQRFAEAKIRKSLKENLGVTVSEYDKEEFEELVDLRMGRKTFGQLNDRAARMWSSQMNNQSGAALQGGQPLEVPPFLRRPNQTGKEADITEKLTLPGLRDIDKYTKGEKGMEEYGGFSGLLDGMKILMEQSVPDKMEEAVRKAAEEMKAPGTVFKGATDKFDTAVDKFIQHMKDLGVSVDVPKADNASKVKSISSLSKADVKKGISKTGAGWSVGL